MRLLIPDEETNPDLRRPVPAVCRILRNNVRGLSGNVNDLTVASFQYDILLFTETFVPYMRHMSELLIPWFGRPVFVKELTFYNVLY